MAPYLCPYCRRMVTYNDNHPCYIYMIEDYENSLRQPNESNERNSKYNYAKFPLTLNDSSGNLPNENERSKYLMNDFETTFSGSSGTDIENQRGPDVSDQIYATTDDECKMSLEDSKSRSLNKDKKNFMDYLECVIRNSFSDNNNISRTAESTANFDLPPGCNEPKNGKVQVSEDVIDEHISPGMHTKGYNNKKKIATDLKEPISTKEDDHAVAGSSGFCSGKKKFPQIFIKKDTPKTNYRTHTDDRHFICVICNKQFSKKSNRDQHYRTHTGETPYVCDGITSKLYLCQLCDNVVTYGENPPCFFYKNYDSVYSLQKRGNLDEKAKDKCVENSNDSFRHSSQADQQNESKKSELIHLSLFQNNEEVKSLSSNGNRCRTLAESSNNAQICNPCDISYFNLISEVQMIEVAAKENTSILVSSENVESRYRLETDQRESCKKTEAVTRSSTFDIQKERGLGVSGVMHTTDDGCKMYLENSKWQSLNKDKNNFIYFLECVINKTISDSNNISGIVSLNVNSVLPHGSKELKNSKRQVSEGETDGLTSLEVQSQVHNKKKKMATDVKKLNSTKKDDDAVTGPSGMCPRKKKFSCRLCSKEFTLQHNLYRHYRTHTGDKPYKCYMAEVQSKEKVTFIASSENFKSVHRPELAIVKLMKIR
ncbi:C2H2 finger domain transcription factor crzA like protein [Argiope bruennichi]|uniref:C2H2 finger domain transcription factor crzA like protein n=1 Tax=Argiope bruennichi TaxID=94029 RepID=A0A8T0FCV4_ARGBR|nr:C2H2 finger domain transcription factor crzA like protein [Argiope bruennichi]